MKIVIDMQGAQSTGSWNRGIGRYTIALALEIAKNANGHEVILVLNGAFSESIERIKAKFENLIPRHNVKIWHGLNSVDYLNSSEKWTRSANEKIRQEFFSSLNPDVVIISSFFEGLMDDG